MVIKYSYSKNFFGVQIPISNSNKFLGKKFAISLISSQGFCHSAIKLVKATGSFSHSVKNIAESWRKPWSFLAENGQSQRKLWSFLAKNDQSFPILGIIFLFKTDLFPIKLIIKKYNKQLK
jgi:hypothetical protein